MSKFSFPDPHSFEPIAGTEGWARMYPYQYQFASGSKERTAYEKNAFWFYDGIHYPEPVYPFDLICDEGWFLALSQNNTRIFAVPPVYGVDHRIINGYVYLAAVPVTDPAEVERRTAHFLERAGHYYQNWKEIEAKWEEKMRSIIGTLDALPIPLLPDLEEKAVVLEAQGASSGYRLLKAWDDLINLDILCWQYHFEMLNLGYAAYLTFMSHCQKVFPDIPIQRVSQMVSGIDVIMYQPDEELKKLARLALDLDLVGLLAAHADFASAKSVLQKSVAGARWLDAFEAARHPWFYITTGSGLSHSGKCWNDDLDIPFSSIRMYAEMAQRGETLDRPVEKVRHERDHITAEYRSLIHDPAELAAFDDLLNMAKTVFPYVENHMFYVEHWFHSLFWNKVREVAAVLKGQGFIDEIEDVWYLKRGEIKDALWDVVTAWATGVMPAGPGRWPTEIAWRKQVLEKFRQWSPPPAVGTAPEVIQEPFTIMLWGVTNESLANWAKVQEAGDLSEIETFSGFPGSPGIVEGTARVCRSIDEMADLQDGDILVSPTTSPAWAPAFTKIRACVTDVGGVMCHAAIVCREYGMPAIVGTGQATKILSTGQTIRVNGSTGEVTIIR